MAADHHRHEWGMYPWGCVGTRFLPKAGVVPVSSKTVGRRLSLSWCLRGDVAGGGSGTVGQDRSVQAGVRLVAGVQSPTRH